MIERQERLRLVTFLVVGLLVLGTTLSASLNSTSSTNLYTGRSTLEMYEKYCHSPATMLNNETSLFQGVEVVEDRFEHVSRVFPVHYIYFDLMFLTVWVLALFWNFRHNRTAILFSAIGLVTYYVVDFGYWYSYAGTRRISGPVDAPVLLLWVSATPGVVHPSWAVLMLEGVFLGSRKKKDMLKWTLLFLCVQTVPAFIQPLFTLDERVVTTTRDMSNGRYVMLVLCLIGYAYMWLKNIPRQVLLKIAIIGALVEGVFEFALTFSGIRPSGLSVFLFDSVFEFNCGMVLLFQLWQLTLPREKRPYPNINTVAEKVRLMYMSGERVKWHFGKAIRSKSKPAAKHHESIISTAAKFIEFQEEELKSL